MNNFKSILAWIIGFVFTLSFSQKIWGDENSDKNMESTRFHGFFSQGFTKSTENNIFNRSINGSFSYSEVALNFTKAIDETFQLGAQLYSRSIGTTGNFDAKFDWFYADYHWKDELSFRFGRLKMPMGLYNESSDVDAGRAAILLPQSTYPLSNRDFLLAQNGFETHGTISLGTSGNLLHRLYAGTLYIETTSTSTASINEVDVPYVYGGRLLWESSDTTLRAGLSAQHLQINLDYTVTGVGSIYANLPATLVMASAEKIFENFTFATEYSLWDVELKSSNSAIVPSEKTTSERYYIQTDYTGFQKMIPGFNYSILHSNIDKKNEAGLFSKDLALYLRMDLTPNWIFKVEGHYIEGTAGLKSPLNDGKKLADLPQHWGMLLLKTTAYF